MLAAKFYLYTLRLVFCAFKGQDDALAGDLLGLRVALLSVGIVVDHPPPRDRLAFFGCLWTDGHGFSGQWSVASGRLKLKQFTAETQRRGEKLKREALSVVFEQPCLLWQHFLPRDQGRVKHKEQTSPIL